MTDTPPEVAQTYRVMLLGRSPEERLKMGCSMGATARALVRASVRAQDPHASPAAVRRLCSCTSTVASSKGSSARGFWCGWART